MGVGKSAHQSSIKNWTQGNSASVCVDQSPYPVWNEWGAGQRDLYILDHTGAVVFEQNITPWSQGIPIDVKSQIVELIEAVPSASASCGDDFADFNLSGGNVDVIDVQCSILTALVQVGDTELPDCLVASLEAADLNCDGSQDVIDVLLVIQAALGFSLDEAIDSDFDGCPDTCSI